MNELHESLPALAWLVATLRGATPLLYAMLGETLVQRAGIINLGTEGQMLVGAAAAYATTAQTSDPWLGVYAGALAGLLLSCMHALLTVRYRANHFASGLAVWMVGFGASSYLGARHVGQSIEGLPALGVLDVSVIGALCAVPLVALLLYWTRAGLHLRAVGEAPHAARAAGLRTSIYQTFAVLAGGTLSGIGGAALSIDLTQAWAEGMTQGRGLIAVGLVIVARWNPLLALPAALVFGAAEALSLRAQAEGAISAHLLHTLPYAVSLAVFVLTCMRKRGDAAPGGLRAAIET